MTEKQRREAEIQVHIWSPDADTHPDEHARMKRFVENKEWLTALLKANGVTRADVMPPQPRLTYKPERDAPWLQYEIIPQTRLSTEQTHKICEAIDDKLELVGTILLPLRADERNVYLSKNGLKEISSPDISRRV